MNKPQVVCIPGSVAPAAQRYRPLIDGVGDAADLHLRDLEVYREATPAPGYSIDEELEAIDRFADSKGLRRFHMVGYSGGGYISLAYAGTRPERVITLALFEPAQIPGKLSVEEKGMFDSLEAKLRGLQGAEFMATFVREQLKPGVPMPPPPPPGPPSPEMQKRPAGIAALIRAFQAFQFDRARFTEGQFPVFLGYGEQMYRYLKPKGIAVMGDRGSVGKGQTGNKNFNVKDPDGHIVEIVEYQPDSWTAREAGKFQPATRISDHIMHVGVLVGRRGSAA